MDVHEFVQARERPGIGVAERSTAHTQHLGVKRRSALEFALEPVEQGEIARADGGIGMHRATQFTLQIERALEQRCGFRVTLLRFERRREMRERVAHAQHQGVCQQSASR